MAKKSTYVSMGCHPPPYIKEWRRGGPASYGAPQGGIPTPSRSRFPPSLVGVGEEGRGRGREGKGGRPPSQFGLGLEGARLPLGRLLLSPTTAH